MNRTDLAPRPPLTAAPREAVRAEQHPLWLSIVLHLFPGATLAAFVIAVSPILEARGVDALFALLIGIGVVSAPLELGYLALYAKRTTGSWNVREAVSYRERLPLRRMVLLAVGLAAWMLVFITASQVVLDTWIADRFFTWLPDAILQMSTVDGGDAIGTGTLIVLLACFFVFNGLVGPVAEELYFRGHLLPRIDRFRTGAPVINAILFSLYHMWTPWRWPSILIGFLPMSWMAWRKRSVWPSMTAHIIVNNIFILLLLATFLAEG
jgi:uncharacterized protein